MSKKRKQLHIGVNDPCLLASETSRNDVWRNEWDVEIFFQIQKKNFPGFDHRVVTNGKRHNVCGLANWFSKGSKVWEHSSLIS